MNDTHDELMKTVLDYLKSSELFEHKPSLRTKLAARKDAKKLMALAHQRYKEIQQTYKDVLADHQRTGKWDVNRGKSRFTGKGKNNNSKTKGTDKKGNN